MSTRLYLITPSASDLVLDIEHYRAVLNTGHVAALQLRMKEATDTEVLRAGEALLPLCRERGVPLIINDRLPVARMLGADGLHVGLGDVSVAEARAALGEDAVIGVSCYGSKDRAFDAGDAGADYVAFGQFYETKTKPPKGRPTPDILAWWSTWTTVPCVAIGGITAENCAPLVRAGADFLAVVTYVWEHPDGPVAGVEALARAIAAASD